MNTLKRMFYWMSTLVAVIGISRTVQADILPVDNADFEKVAVGAGGYTYTIESWQTINEGGGPPAWISNGYYADESTPRSPAIYSTEDEVYQELTGTFVEGTIYTFTMDIGSRSDDDYGWRVYFYNATDGGNTSPVAEATGIITASLAGSDPWNRGAAVVQYAATAADDGDTIGIGFGGATSSYYTLYDNASVSSATDLSPVITRDLQDQTFVLGDPEVTLSLSVVGSPPLSYQWRFGGGDISGATNDVLTIINPGLTDEGDYDVVVGNPLGSVTSAVATLTGTIPPVEPVAKAVLEGDVVTFSVALVSAGTTYQWQRDGVDLAGATGATLTLNPVALSDTGDYTVDIALSGGSVTAGPATLTVAALPTEPYATVITGDGPIAYWRLGESTGASVAADATGSFDADYRADVMLGGSGVTLGDADTSAFFPGTGDSKVDAFPADPADLNPPVFSVDFWVMPTGGSGFRSPVTSRDFFDATEVYGWTFYADDANRWQFRIGQGLVTEGSAWNTIGGPAVVNNQWTHLAGTYDGADMKFYVNGALVGTLQNVTYSRQDFNPLWIGAGMTEDLDDIGDFFWVGRVDEVALFDRALTSQEVLDHYAAAFPATPLAEILSDSTGISRLATEPAVFEVSVHSSPPVTYQWQFGGIDIPGATERVLNLSNVQAADAGMYRVKISNRAGFIFSSEAELAICSGTCDVAVANGGFDDTTGGGLADFWNDNGGSVLGGLEGGYGWTADYYTGGFPTDDAFATTVNGPVRQDLAGRTWVAGATYTLTIDLFSSDTYASSYNDTINWRIALTADGETVAEDAWYSDEFQTAGETVPPGRLISIIQDGGPGLTTATLVYTATAADAGKALGIELGGEVTLGATQGDDYFGHMDNVRLTAVAAVARATMRIESVGGNLVVSWDEPGTLQTTEELPGTWSDVPEATSPVVVIPTTPQNFFRLRD